MVSVSAKARMYMYVYICACLSASDMYCTNGYTTQHLNSSKTPKSKNYINISVKIAKNIQKIKKYLKNLYVFTYTKAILMKWCELSCNSGCTMLLYNQPKGREVKAIWQTKN